MLWFHYQEEQTWFETRTNAFFEQPTFPILFQVYICHDSGLTQGSSCTKKVCSGCTFVHNVHLWMRASQLYRYGRSRKAAGLYAERTRELENRRVNSCINVTAAAWVTMPFPASGSPRGMVLSEHKEAQVENTTCQWPEVASDWNCKRLKNSWGVRLKDPGAWAAFTSKDAKQIVFFSSSSE